MNEKLQKLPPQINKRFEYRVGLLAKRFVREMMKNSPYDTGHLESSWVYDIERTGDGFTITAWNIALSKNGQLYMEWVNDGHGVVVNGMRLPGVWVPGQFFIEATEYDIEHTILPNWETTFSREIARMIRDALS